MANQAQLCLFTLLIASFAIVNVCKAADEIGIYELQKGQFSLKITNYGATVVSLIVPDKNGELDDIVLGFDSIDVYKNGTTYIGAILGRVASRIAGAQFTLDGKTYKLSANSNGNTLHGGFVGFSNVVWTVQSYVKDSHITLAYDSHDGEEGFPGDLSVTVTYMFIEGNKLGIKMQAKSLNKATPVNLATHIYWNLGGHNSGDIFSHTIQIHGSKITPVKEKGIPTGEITPVSGTPYNFLQPRTIGSKFSDLRNGYDINYVIDRTGEGKHLTKAVTVQEDKSGRMMELWTNQPGVQFYTSNWLADTVGKGGFVYKKHAALCLETQGFPDAVNHPNFPSQIVNPGDTYTHVMVYKFTAH